MRSWTSTASGGPSPLHRAHRLEKAPGHPGPHLLQERGRQPARQPQAQHRRGPGLLQQAGGHQAHHHRDRRGPVGQRAGLRLPALRHGVHASTWSRQLRPEALPPHADADLGRQRATASPSDRTERGPQRSSPRTRTTPAAWASPSPRPSRTPSTDEDTKYSLGSVLNHVLLHQTIIGLEAKKQMEMAGRLPGHHHRLRRRRQQLRRLRLPLRARTRSTGKRDIDIIAVEPTACPTLTRGIFRYDFGDTAGLTPLLKMHTLGHDFVPAPIHAGGLRYHGAAPLVSPAGRARA